MRRRGTCGLANGYQAIEAHLHHRIPHSALQGHSKSTQHFRPAQDSALLALGNVLSGRQRSYEALQLWHCPTTACRVRHGFGIAVQRPNLVIAGCTEPARRAQSIARSSRLVRVAGSAQQPISESCTPLLVCLKRCCCKNPWKPDHRFSRHAESLSVDPECLLYLCSSSGFVPLHFKATDCAPHQVILFAGFFLSSFRCFSESKHVTRVSSTPSTIPLSHDVVASRALRVLGATTIFSCTASSLRPPPLHTPPRCFERFFAPYECKLESSKPLITQVTRHGCSRER